MTLVKCMDVASYQPRDLSGLIAEHQPEHVIVHLYSAIERPPWEHSAEQIASARANGCTVGGYCFLYPGSDHVRAINSVLDRCASIGLVLPLLWLDVESYGAANLTPDEVRLAVDHCGALETPCGLYTSREMWSRVGSPGGFETLPVWAAQYDGWPSLEGLTLIPRLPNIVGKQYQGSPIDLSVMLVEYTRLVEPPPPDRCAEAAAALDALLAARPYRRPSRRTLRAVRALLP